MLVYRAGIRTGAEHDDEGTEISPAAEHKRGCSEWSAQPAAEKGANGPMDRDSARCRRGRRPHPDAWTGGCDDPMKTVHVSTPTQRPSIHSLLAAGPHEI